MYFAKRPLVFHYSTQNINRAFFREITSEFTIRELNQPLVFFSNRTLVDPPPPPRPSHSTFTGTPSRSAVRHITQKLSQTHTDLGVRLSSPRVCGHVSGVAPQPKHNPGLSHCTCLALEVRWGPHVDTSRTRFQRRSGQCLCPLTHRQIQTRGLVQALLILTQKACPP